MVASESLIMSDLSFEVLKHQAEQLGLTGEAVAQYVVNQQTIGREERAKEREIEKIKYEAEKYKLDVEHEKVKLEHELELARLNNPSAPEVRCEVERAVRPNLPVYTEGEDIANYLVRFERVAALLNVDVDTYAVRLGSLLTGKAADIYTSLSPEITSKYECLKKALLRGFSKTPDGYRNDFRQSKIKTGESFQQFAVQLGRMFDLWINSRNIVTDYNSLRSFMILDQFVASLPAEIRMFVKEHNVSNLDDAVQLADNWASAHGRYAKSDIATDSGKRNVTVKSPVSQTPDNAYVKKDSKIRCHYCGEFGHIKPKCPKNPFNFRDSSNSQKVTFCFEDSPSMKYITSGTVNGSRVSTIQRDTGCSCIMVSEQVLPDLDVSNCKMVKVFDYLGRADWFPQVKCHIRCPYFTGWVNALRAPLKFCSVLVGNYPGASDPNDLVKDLSSSLEKGEKSQTVLTRSSKMKRVHPLVVPKLEPLKITPTEFSKLQATCPSLATIRIKVKSEELVETRDPNSGFKFECIDGLIYRTCVKSKFNEQVGKHSLVVPSECRTLILSLAHESPLAGHFSHRKTKMRVQEHFYWPGISADIKDYCKSCDRCQRMSVKGKVPPVPLVKMPIMTEPFSRVAIDLVGPLSPSSSEGHRYILTLIDHATGFPEALPLKEIDSVSVAEALLVIFSRVGIPHEILSDRGKQFTSQLMSELHKLLGVKPLFTTPYHPSCNGRIERFHATLKASLRKLCAEKPREWHRYLIPTLFALREIPSDRTGFSAFELLYGRSVRGPLSVLKDLWEDKDADEEERTSFQYVIELRDKLAECAKIAAQNADISTTRYKSYFDLKSQNRQFKVGEEVLVLLPDNASKLLVSWNGPYKVLERRNKVDYLIDEKGKQKLYHANILKKYHRRNQTGQVNPDEKDSLVNDCASIMRVQFCVTEDIDEDDKLSITPDGRVEDVGVESNNEKLCVNPSLEREQEKDIRRLVESFSDVFSEIPGCTSTAEHNIVITTSERLKPKSYPVPIHLQPHFEQEVDNLFRQKIIQHSSSPHSSPVVMVKKSDGTYRMAIDFRSLNAVTLFHAEPICTIEESLYKFTGVKYFSELDLTKAYYQVPLSETAKPLTAFPTHRGLMEFCRLPFGLVNAGATYIKLMRKVLLGLSNVSFYYDNIYVYGKTWDEHITALTQVLGRLRLHNLTARPSKCKFGFNSIQYLGFVVDGQSVKPQFNKVESLLKLPPPTTKKALRSFLGMVSFYRMFIPQASSLTSPMSDMLRKGIREPLVWTRDLQNKFNDLKTALSSDPVLKLPDAKLQFVVRTDASNYGLGAVLLQYHDNYPFPVAYASRKLLDREKRYSTIERECLAIMFGIQRFDYYLRGKHFILEVDHKPLVYMKGCKGSNNRVSRWALNLQPYSFRIVHIAGQDNVGADMLSRCPG